MPKIRPSAALCLTFSDQCEAAVKLYVSLFPDGKIETLNRWGPDAPVQEGKVLYTRFRMGGQNFRAFDGGPYFTFSQGSSIEVLCTDQKQIDRMTAKLVANGGEQMPCGWVRDRFGLSWQIVPENIIKWMTDGAHGDTQAAMAAMLKMTKLNMAELQAAYGQPVAKAKPAKRAKKAKTATKSGKKKAKK